MFRFIDLKPRARQAFFTILIALSLPAAAQQAMGIEEAVRLAKDGNLSLARARISLETAKRLNDASWGAFIPSLSASGSTRIQDYDFDTGTASVQGGISLGLSSSAFTKLKQTRLAYESAKLEYDTAERTLDANIRKSFYNLLLLQEDVKIKEQSLRASKASWEKAEQRYRSGLVSELEVLSSRVSHEILKPDAEKARQDYETALGQFKLDLGLEIGRSVELAGSLDASFEVSSLDGIDWSAPSAALKGLELAADAARATKSASIASAFSPSLSLSWSASGSYPFLTEEWTDSSSLGATLSWSLDFLNPLSSQRQAVKSADEALRKAASSEEEQKRKDALELQGLRMKISRAASTLGASKLSIELAQRSYDLTREAYDKGTKDSLALDDAADKLEEAKVKYLTQANALLSAIIDLEYALGLPFGSLGR